MDRSPLPRPPHLVSIAIKHLFQFQINIKEICCPQQTHNAVEQQHTHTHTAHLYKPNRPQNRLDSPANSFHIPILVQPMGVCDQMAYTGYQSNRNQNNPSFVPSSTTPGSTWSEPNVAEYSTTSPTPPYSSALSQPIQTQTPLEPTPVACGFQWSASTPNVQPRFEANIRHAGVDPCDGAAPMGNGCNCGPAARGIKCFFRNPSQLIHPDHTGTNQPTLGKKGLLSCGGGGGLNYSIKHAAQLSTLQTLPRMRG